MPIEQPTKEQVAEARSWFDEERMDEIADAGFAKSEVQIRVLLAATAPDPGPPRPDDMVELARLVAKELRSRGIWAITRGQNLPQVVSVPMLRGTANQWWQNYLLTDSNFDNLSPREIAEVIQAEEAQRAKEWASDAE